MINHEMPHPIIFKGAGCGAAYSNRHHEVTGAAGAVFIDQADFFQRSAVEMPDAPGVQTFQHCRFGIGLYGVKNPSGETVYQVFRVALVDMRIHTVHGFSGLLCRQQGGDTFK